MKFTVVMTPGREDGAYIVECQGSNRGCLEFLVATGQSLPDDRV